MNRMYNYKVMKPKKKPLIIVYFLFPLVILLLWLNVNKPVIVRYLNENVIYKDDLEIEMSTSKKLDEFEVLCNLIKYSVPSSINVEERYGFSWNDNITKYKEYIISSRDNFEYFCILNGIISDLPSYHTYLMGPSYYNYENFDGYKSDYLYGIWDLKSYTDYWSSSIMSASNDNYHDEYYYCVYVDGDGKYFVDNYSGICKSFDELHGAYIQSIDGESVDTFILNNLFYSKLSYDDINNKPFRGEFFLTSKSKYGRKYLIQFVLPDGSTIEKELYYSCCDDIILLSHGFDNDEEISLSSGSKRDKPYYLYSDDINDICYMDIRSLDYGFGPEIKEALLKCNNSNIIIDLRSNGGGRFRNFQDYLYPALFSDDFVFSNKYYVPLTKENNSSIYKRDIVWNIYSHFEYPKEYANSDISDMLGNKTIVRESIYNFIGERKDNPSVYVLVKGTTGSAADLFVSILKEKQNVIIVGSHTAGEGLGGSYAFCELPYSKLCISYYPALAYNSDGTDNSIYGTSCDNEQYYWNHDQMYDCMDMIYKNNSIDYPDEYENMLEWDNQFIYTVNMIKAKNNDNSKDISN